MNRVLVLSLGLGARALSILASFASDWLFGILADGECVGINLLKDGCLLAEWLIQAVARYMSGEASSNSMHWNY